MSAPIHLIKGNDPVLQADRARDLIHGLVGDGDRSMMVDEYEGDDYELADVVNAAQTPPFLSERRVVLARHAGRFTTADLVDPLVRYLADPLPTSTVVLVWEKAPNQQRVGNVPKSLSTAVKESGGETIATAAPSGKGRSSWVNEQIAATDLSVSSAGARLIEASLGDDVNRLRSVLEVLASTYGSDQPLGPAEIEPYLGEAGGVPPWELTDAIDQGNIPLALENLTRMLAGGGRHPLQLLATLQTHFGRMLALDGAAVGGEKAAAEYLGMKGSTFPAKKAMAQSRRLGSDGVRQAALLLSDADVDLRGRSAWPGELVLEVVVARLSRLAR